MIHISLKSNNEKTGSIPVSTSGERTCPDACPLKAKGCYAKSGPLNWHWRRVSAGERGESFASFCQTIRNLPSGQLWRHNQAGDLPGTGNAINTRQLEKLVKANKGRKGFTYTHKPVIGTTSQIQKNRQAIHQANKAGFTINLSANGFHEVDHLVDLNIGPVVTIAPTEFQGSTKTPKGRKIIQCPATRKDSTVTCASCGLCQKQRGCIVAFPAHGTMKKTASKIASQ